MNARGVVRSETNNAYENKKDRCIKYVYVCCVCVIHIWIIPMYFEHIVWMVRYENKWMLLICVLCNVKSFIDHWSKKCACMKINRDGNALSTIEKSMNYWRKVSYGILVVALKLFLCFVTFMDFRYCHSFIHSVEWNSQRNYVFNSFFFA